jgi:hypothetical protein
MPSHRSVRSHESNGAVRLDFAKPESKSQCQVKALSLADSGPFNTWLCRNRNFSTVNQRSKGDFELQRGPSESVHETERHDYRHLRSREYF